MRWLLRRTTTSRRAGTGDRTHAGGTCGCPRGARNGCQCHLCGTERDAGPRYQTLERAQEERSGKGPGDPARADGRADPRRPAARCHPRSHLAGLLAAPRGPSDAGDGSRSGDRRIRSFVRLGRRRVEFVAISDAQRHLAPRLPWAAASTTGSPPPSGPIGATRTTTCSSSAGLPRTSLHVAIDASRAAGMRLVVAGGARGLAEQRYVEEQVRPRLGSDVELVGEATYEMKQELLAGARCLSSRSCGRSRSAWCRWKPWRPEPRLSRWAADLCPR